MLKKTLFLFMLSSVSTFAFATTTLNCKSLDTVALNRFDATAEVSISDAGTTVAILKISTQMAGESSIRSKEFGLAMRGATKEISSNQLNANAFTLMQLETTLDSQSYRLIVASGLAGPQSTLIVRGIPYRAECRLN
ncbi:MAG: hypothetical protein WA160_00545 [Pseudobdellovibrio sp.]